MSCSVSQIEKTLSRNDTGSTGGHQAGILVPKRPEILSFFPELDEGQKNPRAVIVFHDFQDCAWRFSFIHYNNRKWGGTRDEYRLTGMSKYIRLNKLVAGDTLVLSKDRDGLYFVQHRKNTDQVTNSSCLILGSSWKIVRIRKRL